MILTVTLNAALDRTLVAPGFMVGQSRTVDRGLNQGGGKGLNVARALRCLGSPVLALGVAGGLIGQQMRRALDEEGLPYELTAIGAESRICTAIVDPESGTATEINEVGPSIEEPEQEAFLATFDRALERARLVVLSGSLPRGVADHFYGMMIERTRAAGIACLLDTRGAALREGIRAAPLLVKPNQHEAAELLGSHIDVGDGAQVARAMPRPGPAILCLTLGAAGAILHAPAGSWRARPPAVRVVDTVGSGDAFVAGLAAVLLRAMDEDQPGDNSRARQCALVRAEEAITRPAVLESMLRLATAVSVANTLTLGAGRCDARDVERLLPQIAITQLPKQ